MELGTEVGEQPRLQESHLPPYPAVTELWGWQDLPVTVTMDAIQTDHPPQEQIKALV